MRRLTILDTSVASTNLGDQIIMDAVRRELAASMADAFPFTVATHEWMGAKSRSLVRRSDWVIVGGSSLLSSRMWFRSPWKLGPRDVLANPRIVLLGAGWYQFQGPPDPYSRWLLRRALDGSRLHSVRDSYTEGMLRRVGISKVLNTACPTMWSLTPEHCREVAEQPGENVVTTLNTYIPDRHRDRELLDTLRRHYRTVYVWVQTDNDFRYAQELGSGLKFVDPTLAAFDDLLSSDASLDYVGTRLHGGIRALQHRRRTLVIEVDNRARMIREDCGLPCVPRGDVEQLSNRIRQPFQTCLNLPWEAISAWRRQLCADSV